jgi:hypothetical protein
MIPAYKKPGPVWLGKTGETGDILNGVIFPISVDRAGRVV